MECPSKDCPLAKDIQWLDRHLETRIKNVQDVLDKAESQLDKRLIGMNEFRETLRDQSGLFFTRAEHDIYAKKIDEDVRLLREYRATMEGKASQSSVNVALIIAVVGIIIGVITLAHSLFKL